MSRSIHRFVFLLSLLLDPFRIKGHLVGQRFGAARPIHMIETEADQMLGHVGTERGHCLRINAVSFACQLV